MFGALFCGDGRIQGPVWSNITSPHGWNRKDCMDRGIRFDEELFVCTVLYGALPNS
jgi:hypothetical protein